MAIQPLINKFRARINNDKSNMKTFINLVKSVVAASSQHATCCVTAAELDPERREGMTSLRGACCSQGCSRVTVIATTVRICIESCHECTFFLGVNRPPLLVGANRFVQVTTLLPLAVGAFS